MSSVVYKGVKIEASRNSWSGLWRASYCLPGEDESHTDYFAQAREIAINYAKRNIDRALSPRWWLKL